MLRKKSKLVNLRMNDNRFDESKNEFKKRFPNIPDNIISLFKTNDKEKVSEELSKIDTSFDFDLKIIKTLKELKIYNHVCDCMKKLNVKHDIKKVFHIVMECIQLNFSFHVIQEDIIANFVEGINENFEKMLI